jgi:glutamate--cysteine ligase/glutathione synthase
VSYLTPGYESLELSTQLVISEALNRGHRVEVLDHQDNFIRISSDRGVEYIKQATCTGADSYIAPLLMENKAVTKSVLAEAGLRVPAGEIFSSPEQAFGAFRKWQKRSFVIKPNMTNFGKAVEIFPHGTDQEHYETAVTEAFRHGDTVLAEEFFPGREYRFLVIGDYVRAVLHRVPANVIGDGISSISTLVELKNQDPRRGRGYVSPLEKLHLGTVEKEFLASRGLSIDSVPAADETIYLRENSNISTGGDSLDLTDDVHPGYKDLAFAAASAVGAKISGVDMIIPDIAVEPDGQNYGIIELNFNPALHIHDYPYQGENRRVETHVLNLLGL